MRTLSYLDKNFKDAFKWIVDELANPIKYETGIFEDRFPNVKREYDMYKEFYDKMRKEV